MGNITCCSCGNSEEGYGDGGFATYCHFLQRYLKCYELETYRDVPESAFGYCPGFVPEWCDCITVIEEGDNEE